MHAVGSSLPLCDSTQLSISTSSDHRLPSARMLSSLPCLPSSTTMYLHLALSFLCWQLAASQIPTSSSQGPTPTCLQSRQPTDPTPSGYISVLASAIPNACDSQQQIYVIYEPNIIRTYEVQSYNFNISQDAANHFIPAVPSCTTAFQSIVSACIDSSLNSGFRGGWIVIEASNYSTSHFECTGNAPIPNPSASNGPILGADPQETELPVSGTRNMPWDFSTGSAGTALSPGKTRFPPSESRNVDSGTIHTNPSGTGASPDSTGLLPLESPGVAAGTDQRTPGSPVWIASEDTSGSPSQTGLSAGLSYSSGSTFRGSGSGSGQTIQPTFPGGPSETSPSSTGGSQIPTDSGTFDATSDSGANPSTTSIQSGSSFSVSIAGQIPTNTGDIGTIESSNAPSGSEPATNGAVGSSAGSVQNSASGRVTSSGSSGSSGDPTGSFGTSRQNTAPLESNTGASTLDQTTEAVSSHSAGTTSISGEPSSQHIGDISSQGTEGPSNPSPGNTEAPSSQDQGDSGIRATQADLELEMTRPGTGPITPPPAIPTTSMDRESPQASSNGFIIGELLFGLSRSGESYSNDITIPATKTALLQDIDNTEHQLETLFMNMRGTLPPDTGGCSGRTRKQKRGLGDFVGDIFNTVRCAINSLDTLKEHVNIPEPDLPSIEGVLNDVGTLANNIDQNGEENDDEDDGEDDDDDDSSTNDQTSTKESSTNESSSRSLSSGQPSSVSATTTGTLSSTGDTCGGCCPTDEPALPTDGTPAVTAAPTDSDILDKRIVAPGRLHRHIKRRPAVSITEINGCDLQTPNNRPVTIPSYPGGFEFYTSDTKNLLGTLTSISRYYRRLLLTVPPSPSARAPSELYTPCRQE